MSLEDLQTHPSFDRLTNPWIPDIDEACNCQLAVKSKSLIDGADVHLDAT